MASKYVNVGKIFEEDFKNSIPKGIYHYRLRDSVASFNKAIQEQLKYTVDNPCDYFMWNPKNGNFYALELKTTKETSLTYWQKEFEEAGKDKKFMIRKNQILGLTEMAEYNIVAGFVINFRYTNHTYFWYIKDFNNFVKQNDKKSFNEANVVLNNGIRIEQKMLRTHYRYDVEKFLQEIYL